MMRLQKESSGNVRARLTNAQKSQDHLARNKKAVRDHSRSVATRRGEEKTAENAVKTNAARRLRARNYSTARQSGGGDGNVVITQSVLNQLLQMASERGSVVDRETSAEKLTADRGAHVAPAASQVPGLVFEGSASTAGSNTGTIVPASVPLPAALTQGRGLSQREQWLADLNDQAAEKKARREQEQRRKQEAAVDEDYNPWGRPGCGAPILSQTGQVVTDYRQRQRETEDSPPGGSTSKSRQPPRFSPTREELPQHLTATHSEKLTLREKERRKQETEAVVDYNPWGRPGCGAPVRSQTGQVLTNPRQRRAAKRSELDDTSEGYPSTQTSPNRIVESSRHLERPPRHKTQNRGLPRLPEASSLNETYRLGSPPSVGASATPQLQASGTACHDTPHFGRGAGPYVDKFVLEQKAQQRRRQLEHMEFVREQIAAKELLKKQEKLLHEKEEREAEERLAKEREMMRRENERDKLKAKRKEEGIRQRHLDLQRKIALAEEDARVAKQATRVASNKQAPSAARMNSNRHAPAATNSGYTTALRHSTVLRSPSMLRTGSPPPTPRHAHRRPPQQANLSRASQAGQWNERGATHSKGSCLKPSRIPIRNNSTLIMKLKQREQRRVVATTSTALPPLSRASAPSPPIPAVATRLHRARAEGRDPFETSPAPPLPPIRACSPPVPALAKKLAAEVVQVPDSLPRRQQLQGREVHNYSPPVPALSNKTTRVTKTESGSTAAGKEAVASSPIAASVRQMENGRGRGVSDGGGGGGGKRRSGEAAGAASSQGVVQPCTFASGTETTPTLHLPPITQHAPPRHNQSLAVQSPHLPPVHLPPPHPSQPPLPSHDEFEQRHALQHLAMLRKKILTHTNGMDYTVQHIMSQNPCHF